MDENFYLSNLDLSNFVPTTSLVTMWALKPSADTGLYVRKTPIYIETSNPKWESNRFIILGNCCQIFKLENADNYYKMDNDVAKYLVKMHNRVIMDALEAAVIGKYRRDDKLVIMLEDALINVA